VQQGLCVPGKEVVVLTSTLVANDPMPEREMFVAIAPGTLDYQALGSLAPFTHALDPAMVAKTISLRSTIIDLDMIVNPTTTGTAWHPEVMWYKLRSTPPSQ
jgi:hypothetical protein